MMVSSCDILICYQYSLIGRDFLNTPNFNLSIIIFRLVTVHCKDTRIVVNVGTNRPFSGRIYALGRSETCNVDVISSDSFRLDLTMAGQDCNTQSVVSISFQAK